MIEALEKTFSHAFNDKLDKVRGFPILTVNDVINKSGIMKDYPADEVATLINAVSYLKDSVPLNILGKIRGSMASE